MMTWWTKDEKSHGIFSASILTHYQKFDLNLSVQEIL